MEYQIMKTFSQYYREHISEIDAVLLDIDGTVLLGPRPITNSPEFIDELRSNGTPFYFLTNDGNHSLEEKCSFLRKCGVNAEPDEIISCSSVLAQVAEETNCKGKKFFILGELGNPPYALQAGITECRNIDELDECVGVINGEGIYDWRTHMEAVIGYFLDHPDAPYIVPNPDSYWPNSKTGKYGIGAGGQARFIQGILNEMGIQKELLYLGKPYKGIYDYTLNKLAKRYPGKKLDRSRIYGIGDYLKSDIRGANLNGLKSVFVLSGVSKKEHLSDAPADCLPALTFDRLG